MKWHKFPEEQPEPWHEYLWFYPKNRMRFLASYCDGDWYGDTNQPWEYDGEPLYFCDVELPDGA